MTRELEESRIAWITARSHFTHADRPIATFDATASLLVPPKSEGGARRVAAASGAALSFCLASAVMLAKPKPVAGLPGLARVLAARPPNAQCRSAQSRNSQAMGRVGEVMLRTWQTAHKMEASAERCRAAAKRHDNLRVKG